VGGWADGGEEAVEEDGVQDAYGGSRGDQRLLCFYCAVRVGFVG
jgi:hypothetical protein